MAFDKNLALKHYSSSFGNRPEALQAYCDEEAYTRDPRKLAKEFDEIQGAIWGVILAKGGKGGLTRHELEAITRKHVSKNVPWVSEVGITGFMEWITWMAWHEGYLRKGSVR